MTDSNVMTIEEMIRLSFRDKDTNVVNFNLIRTLLHLFARQLKVLERKVEVKLDTPYNADWVVSNIKVTEVKIHASTSHAKANKKSTKYSLGKKRPEAVRFNPSLKKSLQSKPSTRKPSQSTERAQKFSEDVYFQPPDDTDNMLLYFSPRFSGSKHFTSKSSLTDSIATTKLKLGDEINEKDMPFEIMQSKHSAVDKPEEKASKRSLDTLLYKVDTKTALGKKRIAAAAAGNVPSAPKPQIIIKDIHKHTTDTDTDDIITRKIIILKKVRRRIKQKHPQTLPPHNTSDSSEIDLDKYRLSTEPYLGDDFVPIDLTLKPIEDEEKNKRKSRLGSGGIRFSLDDEVGAKGKQRSSKDSDQDSLKGARADQGKLDRNKRDEIGKGSQPSKDAYEPGGRAETDEDQYQLDKGLKDANQLAEGRDADSDKDRLRKGKHLTDKDKDQLKEGSQAETDQNELQRGKTGADKYSVEEELGENGKGKYGDDDKLGTGKDSDKLEIGKYGDRDKLDSSKENDQDKLGTGKYGDRDKLGISTDGDQDKLSTGKDGYRYKLDTDEGEDRDTQGIGKDKFDTSNDSDKYELGSGKDSDRDEFGASKDDDQDNLGLDRKDGDRDKFGTIKDGDQDNLGIGKDGDLDEFSASKDVDQSKIGTGKDGNRDEFSTIKDGDQDNLGTVKDSDRDEFGTSKDGDQGKLRRSKDGDRDEFGTSKDGDKGKLGRSKDGDRDIFGTSKDGDQGKLGTGKDGDRDKFGTRKDSDQDNLGTGKDGDQDKFGTSKDGDQDSLGTGKDGDRDKFGTSKDGDQDKLGTGIDDDQDKRDKDIFGKDAKISGRDGEHDGKIGQEGLRHSSSDLNVSKYYIKSKKDTQYAPGEDKLRERILIVEKSPSEVETGQMSKFPFVSREQFLALEEEFYDVQNILYSGSPKDWQDQKLMKALGKGTTSIDPIAALQLSASLESTENKVEALCDILSSLAQQFPGCIDEKELSELMKCAVNAKQLRKNAGAISKVKSPTSTKLKSVKKEEIKDVLERVITVGKKDIKSTAIGGFPIKIEEEEMEKNGFGLLMPISSRLPFKSSTLSELKPGDESTGVRSSDFVTYKKMDSEFETLAKSILTECNKAKKRCTEQVDGLMKEFKGYEEALKATSNIKAPLEDVNALIANFAKGVNRIEKNLSTTMSSYMEDIMQMQFSLEYHVESMMEALANVQGDPAAIADFSKLLNFFFEKRQALYDKQIDTGADQNRLASGLEALKAIILTLTSNKYDRVNFTESLKNLVNICDLNTLIPYVTFEATWNDIDRKIFKAFSSFDAVEENWQEHITHTAQQLCGKADKLEIDLLFNIIKMHCNNLGGKIRELGAIVDYDPAEPSSRLIIRDVNCLSCRTEPAKHKGNAYKGRGETSKTTTPRMIGKENALGLKGLTHVRPCYPGEPIKHVLDQRAKYCPHYCGGDAKPENLLKVQVESRQPKIKKCSCSDKMNKLKKPCLRCNPKQSGRFK